MKLKSITLLYGFVAVVLLSSTSVFGQISPKPRIRTSAPEAIENSQPDLTIKEICLITPMDLESGRMLYEKSYIKVAVANAGTIKADAFEVGLQSLNESGRWYTHKGAGHSTFLIKQVDGLEPGKEIYVRFVPNNPGFDVTGAPGFEVTVDPTYNKWILEETLDYPSDWQSEKYIARSRILESNEGNNMLKTMQSEWKLEIKYGRSSCSPPQGTLLKKIDPGIQKILRKP